jgi:hypothetical protein
MCVICVLALFHSCVNISFDCSLSQFPEQKLLEFGLPLAFFKGY